MAFGTGHHATTSTVLRLLVDAAGPLRATGKKWSMADLGCGSGILAIAASKLGATSCLGLRLRSAGRENLERERQAQWHAEGHASRRSTCSNGSRQTWDIVAANIFHDVLEAAFPQISLRSVAPGGVLMLSGILNSQARDLPRSRKARRLHRHEGRHERQVGHRAGDGQKGLTPRYAKAVFSGTSALKP
jgi:ribosomal protein L11 methyltransferase